MLEKQKRKSIGVFILAIVLASILGMEIFFIIQAEYQQNLYQFIQDTAQTIQKQYPESEEDIIQSLFIEKSTASKEDILEKYGITPEEITKNYQPTKQFEQKVIFLMIGTFAFFLITTILCFLFYHRKQTKQIRQIDQYCKEILKGNYMLDLKSEEEGDISILQNDIYDMTVMLKEKNRHLEENKQETEKLIADISHQIKTPITSLNMIHDVLEIPDLPNTKKEELLQNMQKELDKMTWLIKTILNMAKLDSKTMILQRKEVEAEQMMQEIKQRFEAMCQIKEVCLQVEILPKKIEENQVKTKLVQKTKTQKNPHLLCDKKWTSEAIGNIVKNAMEHGAKKIILQVEENSLYTQINITDDGEGIDEEDIPHIFERFYKSKNSKEDSLGLGLAFSKSIIVNQEGDIKVKSKKGKGTQFQIKLYFY